MHQDLNTPQQHGSPAITPKFHGSGTELAILSLKSAIFTVFTFGIYSFWGRTAIRDYLWKSFEFRGHRLRYTGTGGELFAGFLKAIAIYFGASIVFGVGAVIAKQAGAAVLSLYTFIAYMGMLSLMPLAIFVRQQYLYSRTTWMGMQFSLRNNVADFVKEFIRGGALTFLTLGIYAPITSNRLHRIRINSGSIGTMQMMYTGKDNDAFKIFLKSLPFMIITLGIYYHWYDAKIFNYRMQNTWIGGKEMGAAKGASSVTGMDLFMLRFVSALAVIFTLGLAAPWVMANNLKFFASRISFVGAVNFDKIVQTKAEGTAIADGLAEVLGA